MKDVPIRRITFTTPEQERIALTQEALVLFSSQRHADMLRFIEARLASQPEQSDVVHDVLVYLAEQQLSHNQQRKEAQEDLLLGLESMLTEAELKKLDRLWTPPDAEKIKGNEEAQKKFAEAQQQLGILASRILSLDEDIGLLNEEQWRGLLKKRLGKPDLVALTKLYRKYQPPIATLDQRIRSTDRLIDQIVYRLYGLTEEDMRVVAGAGHSQNPTRRDQL